MPIKAIVSVKAMPNRLIAVKNFLEAEGVAPGQIVVDCHDMHTLAAQCIEIGRKGGYQGLALTGAHLGDLAIVEHHAADQLDIEVAHAQHPPRRLPPTRRVRTTRPRPRPPAVGATVPSRCPTANGA